MLPHREKTLKGFEEKILKFKEFIVNFDEFNDIFFIEPIIIE